MISASDIQQLRDQGLTYAGIAAKLNAENIPNPKRGGKWHPETVVRVLKGNPKCVSAKNRLDRGVFIAVVAELAKGPRNAEIVANLRPFLTAEEIAKIAA